MKLGKYIQLGEYKNLKIGYGTVDNKNLKTIYIKIKSWLEPMVETEYDEVICKIRKKIIKDLYNLKNPLFKPECIVDLDVRTKGMMFNKESFMDLDITLYMNEYVEIKKMKNVILTLSKEIIDNQLVNQNIFKFNVNKKTKKK